MSARSAFRRLVKPLSSIIVKVAGIDVVEVLRKLDDLQRELRLLTARLDLHERYFDLQNNKQTKIHPLYETSPTPMLREWQTLEKSLDSLRQLAPNAFQEWREAFDAGVQSYRDFPPDSCSVKGHFVSNLFRWFLRPLLHGRVLDIGCGPQPVPWYLEGYPLQLLCGLDPISFQEDHPFFFAQGVAEFLPWEDASFGTVIAATSLDHVFLLDRVLSEVHRVLKKDGRFVVWVGFIKGARKYDPYGQDVRRVDRYHLFNFDRDWFEEIIQTLFDIEETYECPKPEVSVFYSLRPKQSEPRILDTYANWRR